MNTYKQMSRELKIFVWISFAMALTWPVYQIIAHLFR